MDSGGWHLFLRFLAANNLFDRGLYGKEGAASGNINPSQLFQYLHVITPCLFSCSAGFSFLYKLESCPRSLFSICNGRAECLEKAGCFIGLWLSH